MKQLQVQTEIADEAATSASSIAFAHYRILQIVPVRKTARCFILVENDGNSHKSHFASVEYDEQYSSDKWPLQLVLTSLLETTDRLPRVNSNFWQTT